MKYLLRSMIIVLLLQITIPVFAQTNSNTPEPDIASIIDTIFYGHEAGFVNSKSIVGAAIGVYWKGKSYYKTYGYADREQKMKTDIHTLFEIGSNTKVFTGLMLSSEMAEGKMSGDDFIEKYVAVHKNIRNKVRLTDIANHTSGLPTFHDSASLTELMQKDTTKDPLMLITDDYVLSLLKKTDTLHNYGAYEYSNLGVGLLGYILQKKNNATYEQLLQRKICTPLGLKNTTIMVDTNDKRVARVYNAKERTPFINLTNTMQGAGAIKSDIIDMMTFVKAQITGNKLMQNALDISQKVYHSEENVKVAMGWHIAQLYGADVYEMRGDTYGASSLMMFDKQDELGIVVLLNSANSGVVMRCMDLIMAKLLDTSGMQDRFSQPEILVDKKILDSYIGIYELQPGFDADITIEDGKLVAQLTGQPKVVFKAVANNWFVVEELNCQLEFIRNPDGACNEFILNQNTAQITCKRK